jgi:hypothetical protein
MPTMSTTSWRSRSMAERIVIDTGPIVALARAGALGGRREWFGEGGGGKVTGV